MVYIPKNKNKPTFLDVLGRWSSFPEFYKRIPGADTYKAEKEIIIRDFLQQFWGSELPLSRKKIIKPLAYGGKERVSVECCSEEALASLEKKLFPLDYSKHKQIKNNSLLNEEDKKRSFSAKRLKKFSEDMGVEVNLVVDFMIENFSEIQAFLPDSVKVLATGMVDGIHEFSEENAEVDIEPSFIVINENHLRAIRDGGKSTLHSLRIEDFQRFSYIEKAIEDKLYSCPLVSNFVKFCEPVTLTQDNLYVTAHDEHTLKKAIVDMPKIKVKEKAPSTSNEKVNVEKIVLHGNHELQEDSILDEIDRRCFNPKETVKGEKASLQRFFYNKYHLSEGTFNKAWDRLKHKGLVKSLNRTIN